MSLLAALDNMTPAVFAEATDQLSELLVNVGIAINQTNGDEDFDPSHFNALVRASLSFTEEEGHDGNDENGYAIYVKAYQEAYKSVMGQEYDDDVWNDLDFNCVPESVIQRIGAACGQQDAVDTKGWYAYCAARKAEDNE